MLDRDAVVDVDQEWVVFEQGYAEDERIVRVKLGGVDGGLEFGGADADLGGEIPEDGATVLRCGEEVATTSRPASWLSDDVVIKKMSGTQMARLSRSGGQAKPVVRHVTNIPDALYLLPVASQLHCNTIRFHIPRSPSVSVLGGVSGGRFDSRSPRDLPNDDFAICSSCGEVVAFPVEANSGGMAGFCARLVSPSAQARSRRDTIISVRVRLT